MSGSEGVVLQEKDLQTLARMLGMLGTSNDNERAVVGSKIHAWVTSRGLVWSELLIPDESAPVEMKVNVGGRPAGASTASPPPPPHNPHRPGFTAAQQAYSAATGQPQPWPANAPAWGRLAEEMLVNHQPLLRGGKEEQFLADQIARARAYGSKVRISDKQEAWLRDILGRAQLTW